MCVCVCIGVFGSIMPSLRCCAPLVEHHPVTPARFCTTGSRCQACARGFLLTVQWLVEQGANYVARDKWGDTPIHKASYGNHEAVCTFLLGKSSPSSVQTLPFLPPPLLSPQHAFFLSRSTANNAPRFLRTRLRPAGGKR